MFDFSLGELAVIGAVALIVIGPERLPKVARTAGHLMGRMQRYVSDVKSDIQREIQLEELKKLQEDVRQQAGDFERSIRNQVASVEADLGETAAEIKSALPGESLPEPLPAPTETTVQTETAGDAETEPVEPSPQLELSLDAAAAPRPAAPEQSSGKI